VHLHRSQMYNSDRATVLGTYFPLSYAVNGQHCTNLWGVHTCEQERDRVISKMSILEAYFFEIVPSLVETISSFAT